MQIIKREELPEQRQVRLTIAVDKDTWQASLAKCYQGVKSVCPVAGEPTRENLEQAYGPEFLYQEAVNDTYPQALVEAISQSDIQIAGTPTLSVETIGPDGYTFAAVIDLMEAGVPENRRFIPIPGSARQVDERFAITAEENERLIGDFFPHGPLGPLKNLPLREKKRVAVLRHLLRHFDARRIYTEKEVTDILKPIYADYATLRRLFVDYGFLARKTDGSAYWVQP